MERFVFDSVAKDSRARADPSIAYGCEIDAATLLETAQKMVDFGLRDLGYNYVILDDCWSNMQRSDDGSLVANATKFPDGIKAVADEIHRMGLLFGMYSSAGMYTCAQYLESLGHEEQDAQTFADWGVDYLKYDNCYNQGQEGNSLITFDRYNTMSEALNKTGTFVISLSIGHKRCAAGQRAQSATVH